jgi:hypothetical protein
MSLINRAVKQGLAPSAIEPKTKKKSAKSLEQHIEQAPVAVPVPPSHTEQDIRLAICVPCRDMIHTTFSHNLHSLLQYNWQKGIETKVFYNMSTLLQNQREHLVNAAKSWEATHILWLDSDMSFPFYTAYKLLDHKQPIVAGNYVTRQMPYKTVAYPQQGDWSQFLTHTNEQPILKQLTEVECMGLGCMLVDMQVYHTLKKPYFEIKYQLESDDYLGEDINFCQMARAKGFKIMVDDIISRQLCHLGQFAFGHDLVKNK